MADTLPPPKVYVWHQNRQQGPFTAAALTGAIRAGKFPDTTPAWTDDDDKWRPLSKILKEITEQTTESTPGNTAPEIFLATDTQDVSNISNNSKSKLTKHWPLLVIVVGIFMLIVVAALFSHKGNTTSAHIASNTTDAEQCTVLIQGEGGSGSGSLVWQDDSYYLYTNVHVASLNNITASDYRGREILIPESCEVPKESGVDLVRFKLIEAPEKALVFANRSTIEEHGEAFAIGDSGGKGVLRTLPGQVIGIGARKIEVDCEFIQGNSGGPIVNADGELLALASYMTSNRTIWAKGTSLEIRRFGWIPSADYTWQETTAEELFQERLIAEECLATSRLLIALSYLDMNTNGFKVSQKWPIKHTSIGDVLANAEGHTLRAALSVTDRNMVRISKNDSAMARSTARREYLKFFNECEKYALEELVDAEAAIKSGFWSERFETKFPLHDNILKDFGKSLKAYEASPQLGRCLSEY